MTASSNANTSGLEVVAWRWETPIPHVGDGTKWGWSFASHWSTPPSSLNPEPLVTAASAQAAIGEQEETIESLKRLVDQHYDRATAAEARADRMAKALTDAIEDLLTSLRFRGGWECSEDELVGEYRSALQQETQP